MADEHSTQRMAEQTLSAFGRIDVLVNNAAVFATIPISRVPLEQISVAEWDLVMSVNLRGIFLACKAVLPAMRERSYGKIINISSGTALSKPERGRCALAQRARSRSRAATGATASGPGRRGGVSSLSR